MNLSLEVTAGSPLPLGVHIHNGGVNFALFSRHAKQVWLLLFADVQATDACQIIELHPRRNRTGDIWHIRIHGAQRGLAYAYRVDGPYAPEAGHRFDRNKVILDPYATALVGTDNWDFAPPSSHHEIRPHKLANDPDPATVKCLVTANGFDWGEDKQLYHPWSKVVIYETHVRGLTVHPSSLARAPGTYLGVIEKIPYFKRLGITAVELMPLQQFNPRETVRVNPMTGGRLVNYWGYNTVAFFAPYHGYSSRQYPGCQVNEFKMMVKALHEAGIEVFLDVVFNHTAEGNETGPTLNFRGLDNRIYYLLEKDKRHYTNYSGCGNTINCNHPIVRSYILDCLIYWVIEMHVDGFRFDLASILGRDQSGRLMTNAPLLEKIAEDPILRNIKLIAEAWDAGGAFQVGRFPGERWCEWNGYFRDDVRRFWRGEPGTIGPLATRLCGSADLYDHSGKAPVNSINFVTCHDGFTLNDLVSYQYKHNTANGENGRDGSTENFSMNYGVEGPTDDPTINRLRLRHMKNLVATLFLSRGVPMLLGGDEFARTQKGNNNAYCQDNEISWYDWKLLEDNRDLFRFVQCMIAFRARYPVLSYELFYLREEISWFNPGGRDPDWEKDTALGCYIRPTHKNPDGLCLLLNPCAELALFRLPDPPAGRTWRLRIDTSAASPLDIDVSGRGITLANRQFLHVNDRTLCVLAAS